MSKQAWERLSAHRTTTGWGSLIQINTLKALRNPV